MSRERQEQKRKALDALLGVSRDREEVLRLRSLLVEARDELRYLVEHGDDHNRGADAALLARLDAEVGP